MKDQEINFSPYAQKKWEEAKETLKATVTSLITISVFTALSLTLLYIFPSDPPPPPSRILHIGFPGFLIVCLIGIFILMPIRRKKIQALRQEINLLNQKDFAQGQMIFAAMVEFTRQNFVACQEETGWRPIRLEYHLTQDLQADLEGHFQGIWRGLLAGIMQGNLTGKITGVISPQLVGESTFIILKKGEQTLRLISPPISAAKQVILNILNQWLKRYDEKSYLWQSAKNIIYGRKDWLDHQKNQVWQTTGDLRSMEEILAHLDMINLSAFHDQIAGILEEPYEKRRLIIIKGIPIKPGVILADTIRITGQSNQTVFPAAFIQALESKLGSLRPSSLRQSLKE